MHRFYTQIPEGGKLPQREAPRARLAHGDLVRSLQFGSESGNPIPQFLSRGVTKCVPLKVERKLYSAALLVRLITVNRRLHW